MGYLWTCRLELCLLGVTLLSGGGGGVFRGGGFTKVKLARLKGCFWWCLGGGRVGPENPHKGKPPPPPTKQGDTEQTQFQSASP